MISVKDVVMRYGSVVAVNRVSFDVEKGKILGLLGPNGAGKTTLMRILTTMLVPNEGKASIGDHDVVGKPLEVRKLLGYLPETAPLYMEMRVDEYLRFVAQARGLSARQAKERIEWVVEKTSLRGMYKHTINELSKGYKQRVGLAQALVHDPQILILDEPTSGLDPLQIVDIRHLIKELAVDHKKTIIFSTHIMQEASAVSDRIVIIHEGVKIADGTVEDLEAQAMGTDCWLLVVKASRQDVHNALGGLRSATRITPMDESRDGFAQFELRSKFGTRLWEEVDAVVKANGWPLHSFAPRRLSLEDTFLELTRAASKAKAA